MDIDVYKLLFDVKYIALRKKKQTQHPSDNETLDPYQLHVIGNGETWGVDRSISVPWYLNLITPQSIYILQHRTSYAIRTYSFVSFIEYVVYRLVQQIHHIERNLWKWKSLKDYFWEMTKSKIGGSKSYWPIHISDEECLSLYIEGLLREGQKYARGI